MSNNCKRTRKNASSPYIIIYLEAQLTQSTRTQNPGTRISIRVSYIAYISYSSKNAETWKYFQIFPRQAHRAQGNIFYFVVTFFINDNVRGSKSSFYHSPDVKRCAICGCCDIDLRRFTPDLIRSCRPNSYTSHKLSRQGNARLITIHLSFIYYALRKKLYKKKLYTQGIKRHQTSFERRYHLKIQK